MTTPDGGTTGSIPAAWEVARASTQPYVEGSNMVSLAFRTFYKVTLIITRRHAKREAREGATSVEKANALPADCRVCQAWHVDAKGAPSAAR